MVLVVKNPPANAGDTRDMSSIPGSGRSPGGGHGNPHQYSWLENAMDRGAWWTQSIGSQRIGHNWATSLTHSLSAFRDRVCPGLHKNAWYMVPFQKGRSNLECIKRWLLVSLMWFLVTDLKQQTSYISVVFNMDNISEMQFFKIPMVNLENSPIYPSHYINNKIIKKKV